MSGGVSEAEEAGGATAFGGECVDGVAGGIVTARVIDMAAAAAERSAGDAVDNFDDQRRMHPNIGVQATGWAPGTVADAADEFAGCCSGLQRDANAIDCDAEM